MTVVLRPGEEKDRAFAFATWCDSWRAEAFPWVTVTEWKRLVGPQVAERLRRGVFVVACDADDPDRLYGWASGKPGRLWWVYVRDTRRRMGLGARLAEAVCDGKPRTAMVLTPATAEWARRRNVQWTP